MAISKVKYISFTILILLVVIGAVGTIFFFRKNQIGSKPKLIVVAMNGLTFNHIHPKSMPFVTEFYRNGVHCRQMQPVFPTNTFTNLFSIATGLYPESHGVTSNVIYDNKLKKMLKFSPEMFMLRPNVTPIWTLNEMAGKHSAVLWTAGEFMYRNRKPSHAIPVDVEIPWKRHIDENLIPLFLRKECKVTLSMFYVKYPDFVLHRYPPQSQQMADSLRDLDDMMRYLTERLDEVDLLKSTDIIIVSDHGIDTYYFHPEYIDGDIIDLYRVVDKDSCDMFGSSPVLQIVARPGYNQTKLCAKLKLAATFNDNFNVYTNDDLKTEKAHWHVNNPQRFGPCTAVAEPGYVFQDIRDKLKKYRDYEKLVPGEIFGRHGYDNQVPSMQAVFLANGPRFQRAIEIPFLRNIDLYYLFARLLNIAKLVPNLHIDGIDQREIWEKMLIEDAMNDE